MLIALHPFVNIISNNAPSFHSNSYDIPELLLIRGLAPSRLSFSSCQNIGVELPAKFIQAIDIGAFREDTQTIKIFHNDSNAVVWVLLGCLSIRLLMHKIPNLLWDLILGRLLVLGYLKCWCSKFGPLIPDLGGSTFIMDHGDQLRSQWVSAFSKWIGACIELCRLCAEPASCLGFGPTAAPMRMTVLGGSTLLAMRPMAPVVIWMLVHVVGIGRGKVWS
jgi:hypothetical protein